MHSEAIAGSGMQAGATINKAERCDRYWTLFFFQAEDGIRYVAVTGVQTCALPISLMKTLTIGARFCGPATSSNGGYFAGLVATLASRTLAVRLLKPPPLDTGLAVRELADGALQVVQGEEPIGEARPALLELDGPPAPEYLEAGGGPAPFAGLSQ